MGDANQPAPLPAGTAVILLSAAGKLFTQEMARRLAKLERIVLICGRYEGVDERVAEHLATDEISVGDFVLSGGELPAAIILDAVTRLLPGALGNEASTENESFRELELSESAAVLTPPGMRKARLLLEYPHYTRPADFRGWKVPEVLVGGNHAEVGKWRRAMAVAKTRRNRPELLDE
jgi:tRNA (guanine37-N1)-methyltransferase